MGPIFTVYLKLYFRHEIPPYISFLNNLSLFLYHFTSLYNPLTVLISLNIKTKTQKKNTS